MAPSSNNDAPSDVHLEGNLGQYAFVNNILFSNMPQPALACGTTYSYLSLTPLVIDHNDIYNTQGPAYGGACPIKPASMATSLPTLSSSAPQAATIN